MMESPMNIKVSEREKNQSVQAEIEALVYKSG
jgi:hypothetical protein